jgi:hypothetical protein
MRRGRRRRARHKGRVSLRQLQRLRHVVAARALAPWQRRLLPPRARQAGAARARRGPALPLRAAGAARVLSLLLRRRRRRRRR